MKSKIKKPPVALTIAGSDSGGGAGIQADLKTFAALGVHGTSAITCLTAQNPKTILGIQSAQPEFVRQQLEAVFAEFSPQAVKTGVLFSAEIIRVVINFFKMAKRPPLIVDPVMIATTGQELLKPGALKILKNDLLPLASLVTPNLNEAEILMGNKISSLEELRAAAKEIYFRFGCAALVKGGHLKNINDAIDFFYDGKTELMLSAPFIKYISTRGTGCVYSAAIAGYLALENDLPKAVHRAKEFISQAIAQSWRVGNHFVLNSIWKE
ncbi:MAG: bifunctional hydroxymethylpyrimidine kinase/phosphomethylpyrimidine kinase [Verrucomicrobiota bacterium]|nr:bifunctional hydroxymethylpyrimidine kinase/phosphomethylpyrimidine kinase [Verrucomicrobiota bacterium]